MDAVFLKIVNMSITASWLILAVIVTRTLMKKAPRWIICALWALVGLRMICPFSIESGLSMIPSAETIPAGIEMETKPAIDSGIRIINEVVNPIILNSFAPDPLSSANPLQIWIPRDGSYFAEDIHDKFPIFLWRRAVDVSGADKQHEECLKAAKEYFAK